MKLNLTKLLLIIIAGLSLTLKVNAQGVTTAAINGTIMDSDGNPLPAATVLAVHTPSGTQYGTTTRDDGRYNLSNLRVGGPYEVTVTYIGYTTQKKENFNLELNQSLELNFILSTQAVELESIDVIGNRAAIISSGRTGASTNVTSEQIEEFPTVARSFQDFIKFSPQFNGTSFSAGGRSNRFNNIQLDGTQYNDRFGLGATGSPGGQASINPISLDAVEEFQVVIAPYDVRLSGFTGGGINAITKSGTNTWTGSGYYYTRNENFAGTSPDNLKTKLGKFTEYQTGVSLGGPIVKDKLFFFLNGELTKRDEEVANTSLTQFTGANASALADRFRNILQGYGYNPGDYRSITRERPSTKLFLRFDYNLSSDHKLTLRHNFVDGSDQVISPNVTRLEFPDRAYEFTTNTNSTVLQLNSTFSNNFSNELILGYLRIRDTRAGQNDPFPSIEVRQSGLVLVAGGEQFSQANELDQDIFEITDNFSMYSGDHVFTVGTHNEFYSVRNLFIRDFYGSYIFSSLDSLEAGVVQQYDYSYSNDPSDPRKAAEFSGMQLGVYAQDEWSVMPNLKLTIGVRMDVPIFPDAPEENQTLLEFFGNRGISTSEIPSGNLLFSPRLGFNWDVNSDRTTQVRGGVGLFTGSLPFVWLSNNYSNNGLEFSRIRATTAIDPPFITDPNGQPKAGDPRLTGVAPFTSEINVADPDLKLPQILRLNLGVDHVLPYGITGTLDFIYSKAVNDILYENYNVGSVVGTAPDGRPAFGPKVTNRFTDVLVMKNTSENYSYNITGQLQRNGTEGLYTNIGYTYGTSKDQNSVASSQALSQWTFNPISGDPNAPPLTTSNYEIKHRIFAAVSYTFELFRNFPTTVSVFYNGQSGRPFSYTYFGRDVNGDGSTSNDLIYIPASQSEIIMDYADPAEAQTKWNQLNAYIERDEYLSEHRGEIAERNGAREPWRDDLDFRLAQTVNVYGDHDLIISLDIVNVLNLLNSDWGHVQTVANQNSTLMEYVGKDEASGKAKIKFTDRENPFNKDNILSRWQMQLGIRYAF